MKHFRWILLAAVATCWTSNTKGFAAGYDIVRSVQNQGDQVLRSMPDFFNQIMSAAYAGVKPDLQIAITNLLRRGDLVASGFTFYDLNVALGAEQVTFVDATTLRLDLKGNHIYAKSTLPGPTGKYADPAFEVNFDVRIDLSIIPPSLDHRKIEFSRALVSIPWVELKPRNITGGAITTFAVVVNAFNKAVTGKDLIQNAVRPHLTQDLTGRLNNLLAPVNRGIASIFTRENIEKAEVVLDQTRQNLQSRLQPKPIPIAKAGSSGTTSPHVGTAIDAASGKVPIPKAGSSGTIQSQHAPKF